MIESLRVIVLGSGTSHGIPMIGCDCAVCRSDDPRDHRTRTSVVVEFNGRYVLIDTSPELRLQCLNCGITRVDAIFYTHYHADHVGGLDDLRRFNHLQKTVLTCYGDGATLKVLKEMFPYAFRQRPGYHSGIPQLRHQLIDGPFELFGMRVIPIPLMHGEMPVLGFRFGRFAYCTDCSVIPQESMELLGDLEVLILDGLRRSPHPTHFNLDGAVRVAYTIGARQTYFTHIAHELAHEATNNELPDNMALAYDGQIIRVTDELD